MRNWCIVLLIALLASAVRAAEYDIGAEAYSRGDYEAAFVQWRALARQGDMRAQYSLARMYADGTGVAEDDDAVLYWLRAAARQGSVEAQSELALMFSLGRGVRQNHALAAYWYGRLAEEGHATAQFLLAGMYEDGTGVERDVSLAFFWYQQAAEQGYVGAQVKLGEMLRRGHGVGKDLAEAWVWFDRAAARGNKAAATRRDELRRLLGEEILARPTGSGEPSAVPRQSVESGIAQAQTRTQAETQTRTQARTQTQTQTQTQTRTQAETQAQTQTRTRRQAETQAKAQRQAPRIVPAPEMVPVEAGCFEMGSNPAEAGRGGDEARHSVCVRDFLIARYEVTRGQYAEFVADTGHDTPDGCYSYGNGGWGLQAGRSWRDPGYPQSDDHPVACISRADALAYAKWISEHRGLDYRLPTEAEWEYAARAGTGTARPWGDDAADACEWANVGDRALLGHYSGWPWTIHPCDDEHVHTAPVGTYRTNRNGLYDMAGNVWEWTCSPYDAAYQGGELVCDSGGLNGVVRGGSWSNSPRWARSAGRFANRTDMRLDLVGFRLAHD